MNIKDKIVEEIITAEEVKNNLWKAGFRNTEDRRRYNEAHEKVLDLQRTLAINEHKSYCVPLDFPYKCDVGAPLPHLIQNEHKSILLYFLKSAKKDWFGKSVEVISLSETERWIAVLSFKRCQSTRFGAPNDETLEGHPLYGSGLDYYDAYEVKNSDWIKDLEKINSVHSNHSSKYYEKYKHYFFTFHDSIFECVAMDFEVEVVNSTMEKTYYEYCKKLFN